MLTLGVEHSSWSRTAGTTDQRRSTRRAAIGGASEADGSIAEEPAGDQAQEEEAEPRHYHAVLPLRGVEEQQGPWSLVDAHEANKQEISDITGAWSDG